MFLSLFALRSTNAFQISLQSDCDAVRHIIVDVDELRGHFSAEIATSMILINPYFRLRLVGPRVQMVHAQQQTDYLWRATATLCQGSYFFEPLLLFREFDANNMSRFCVEPNYRL